MEAKFYRCLTCGNIICKIVDSGVTPFCCGSEMVLLEAKSEDTGNEKHLPEIEWIDDCTLRVKVGAVEHPSTEEHHIVMIALEMEHGLSFKVLKPGKAPEAKFKCKKGKVKGVYAYCNIHGLWYRPLRECFF